MGFLQRYMASVFLSAVVLVASPRLWADNAIENLRSVPLATLGLAGIRYPDQDKGFAFSVFVMDDSGWTLSEVGQTIQRAAKIYFEQCRFQLSLRSIQRGTLSGHLQEFNETKQAKLLALLKPERPMVFFVRQTEDQDIAYAYLENAPSPSKGTIWITRRAREQCRGPLLAHEIGHIALNFPSHQADLGNLMSYSCVNSNIQNAAVNTHLNTSQCETLRQRYAD